MATLFLKYVRAQAKLGDKALADGGGHHLISMVTVHYLDKSSISPILSLEKGEMSPRPPRTFQRGVAMFGRPGTKPPYRSGHLWRQYRARIALPIAGVDRSLLGNMVTG